MRRSFFCFRALSPYAAALKHVALRGGAAFGPTARDAERAMYQANQLPADYRPPKDTPWDDTVERWAYAWQYPLPEEALSAAEELVRHPAMDRLVGIAQTLIEAPPSKLPGSAASHSSTSSTTMIGKVGDEDLATMMSSEALPASEEENLLNEVPDADPVSHHEQENLEVKPSSVRLPPPPDEDIAASLSSGPLAAAIADGPRHRYQSASSAVELSEQLGGLPIAYIDDGSEFSSLSMSLGQLLVDEFGLAYDNSGLGTAIEALGVAGRTREANALFRFVQEAGFAIDAKLYAALMEGFARSADVTKVMNLIEQMKEKGITPVRANWHCLMQAFSEAKDYPAVIQVVDNMKSYANIEPDEITFFYHIRALCKDRTRESSRYEAVQLFDQMENVYGYAPTRPLFHAMLTGLCKMHDSQMQLKVRQLAEKMALIGIPWDQQTYRFLLTAAAYAGNVTEVKDLCAKMRADGVPVALTHLERVVHCFTNSLLPPHTVYADLTSSPVPRWFEALQTSFGLFDLAKSRSWEITTSFIDALLRQVSRLAVLSVDQLRNDPLQNEVMGKLEAKAKYIWETLYDEYGLKKSIFSYEHYVALLAQQQRIDEAETLFQELVMSQAEKTEVDLNKRPEAPTPRTYESLILMHLASGEEGGTSRALHYFDALEKAGHPVRNATLRKMVSVSNEASYKRDMKRRARRIMQAREEYLARKESDAAQSEEFGVKPAGGVMESAANAVEAVRGMASPGLSKLGEASGNILQPLPVAATSPVAWWERWKRESISKHELFEEENEDGTPKGAEFAEKNDALRKMGIESKFKTISDLPLQGGGRDSILRKIRAHEGELAGGLWGLDGGDLRYPSGNAGSHGWPATMFQDRLVVKKELDKIRDGHANPQPFSVAGIAQRTASEQLEIERSGAKNSGELFDAEKFPEHRYDDGTAKPASEMAFSPSLSAELVWQHEKKDLLGPFRTDEEVQSLSEDSDFAAKQAKESKEKTEQVIEVIRDKVEDITDIVSKGVTRKGKYDHLAKWREMYRYGTVEVPDRPIERFGLSADDAAYGLAAQVEAWFKRHQRTPPDETMLQRWREEEERGKEFEVSAMYRREIKRAVTPKDWVHKAGDAPPIIPPEPFRN